MSQAAPRTNQKQRTRADLLRSARKLMSGGGQPSVAEVADAAGISRATAYRYFSKPEDLLREATLDALAEIAAPSIGGDEGPVEDRLDRLVARVLALVSDNEALFRTFLANSVAGDTPRGGRRLDWITGTIDLLEINSEAKTRLTQALALLTGIEPLIVLRDVCGLDRNGAEAVLRWSAQAMLKAARAEG